MEFEQLQRAIEAILFAAGEPVETARLSQALETDINEVIRAAQALADAYAFERRGIRIVRLDKAWQMVSSGEMADFVTKALETRKPPKLSGAQLESLTIIAYYQPATKAMVEQIRGVDSSYSISALMNKKLICEAGRLNVPGRPIQYATTPDFLRTFGLSSLEELPEIERVNFGEVVAAETEQKEGA
jgi:segregation and condensation protein B